MQRIFAAALTFLLLTPAWAQRKVVVFPVVPLSGEVSADAADEMTKAMLEEFGLQKGIDVIEGMAPESAKVSADTDRRPARSDADFKKALAAIKDGKNQSQRMRFPAAIKALRSGIEGVRRNVDLLEDYSILVDAHLMLSEAYFRRGKQSAGTDVLETVARLKPDIVLDPDKYPPMFLDIFSQTRRRSLEHRRGGLRITSEPVGATAWVNGRKMGRTPIRVDEVIPGQNHVVIRSSAGTWAKTVEVRSGGITEAHGALGGGGVDTNKVSMADAMGANRFDREVRKAARTAGRGAGGDFVVVATMGKGKGVFAMGAFLGNARTGRWMALDPVAPDFDMLSASIEAHTMARDIQTKIDEFKADVGNETLAFIPGKPVRSGKRKGAVPSGRESVAAFVTRGMIRAASRPSRSAAETEPVASSRTPISAGRGPVTSSRAPVSPTRSPQTSEGPVTSSRGPVSSGPVTSSRGPVSSGPVTSSRGPVTSRSGPAPGSGREVVIERGSQREVVTEPDAARGPRRAPLTSRSRNERTPIGATVIDDDLPLVPPPAGGSEEQFGPVIDGDTGPDDGREEISAVSGSGPLSRTPRGAAELEDDSGSVAGTWWFWTLIGGGVLAAAGGTVAAIMITQQPPGSVNVAAAW